MDETGFSTQNAPELKLEFGNGKNLVSVGETRINFCHEGFRYAVEITHGRIESTADKRILKPKDGTLTVRMKRKIT